MDFLKYLKVYENENTEKVESIVKDQQKKLDAVLKEAFYGEFVSKDEAILRIENDFVDSDRAPKSIDVAYVSENIDGIKEKVENLTEGEIKIIIHNNETPKNGGGCGCAAKPMALDIPIGTLDVEEGAKPKKKRGRPKKQVGGPVEDRVAVENEKKEESVVEDKVEEKKEEPVVEDKVEEKKEEPIEEESKEGKEDDSVEAEDEETIEEKSDEITENDEEEAEAEEEVEEEGDDEEVTIKWSDIEDKLEDFEDDLKSLVGKEAEEGEEEVEEVEGETEEEEDVVEESVDAEQAAYDMFLGGASVEEVISNFPDLDPDMLDELKIKAEDELAGIE